MQKKRRRAMSWSRTNQKPRQTPLLSQRSQPRDAQPSRARQKMSDVLLEFFAPYRHDGQDDATLERVIALAVVAWNVSLLPESEQEDALHQLVTEMSGRKRFVLLRRSGGVVRNRDGGPGGVQAVTESAEVTERKAMVRQMIERKLQSFPHNKRMIVGYQVHLSEKDIELVAESTLQPDDEGHTPWKPTMEEDARARADENESV